MKIRWWGLFLLAHGSHRGAALVTKRQSHGSLEESASRQLPVQQDAGGALDNPAYRAAVEQEQQMRAEERERAVQNIGQMDRKRQRWVNSQEKEDWKPQVGGGRPMWDIEEDYYIYPKDYLENSADFHRVQSTPRTDSGKREQPSYQMGWMAPQPEAPRPQTACVEECHESEYCWEGECTWRPWKYAGAVRKACYADPYQPGLSRSDRSMCRDESATSEADCTAMAWYCRWTYDTPDWYRGLINEEDARQAKKWNEEQQMLKAVANSGKAVDKLATHVQPGNTVYKSVLPPPPERTLRNEPYMTKDMYVWR